MRENWFDEYGIARTRRSEGKKVKGKSAERIERERQEIEFCLNCTKPSCNGSCLELKRFKKAGLTNKAKNDTI